MAEVQKRRLEQPRVWPVEMDALDPDQREVLAPLGRDGSPLNIFRTLAHHPKLLKRWLVFGNHVLGKSTLEAREREILILRVGWLCRAEYELSQHIPIAKRCGLDDDDIARIKQGPDASGLDAFDATLVRAVDELHRDQMLSDDTWRALGARYDHKQVLDLVFTVGQYTLVCMALNTLGVQPETPIPGILS